MSTTCAALIPGLGLTNLQTPALVLITSLETGLVFHTTGLPGGALREGQSEEDGRGVPWRAGLDAIRRGLDEVSEISLDGVDGLEKTVVQGETLAEKVGRVKNQVEAG
ncbi:MAG: hypothetical protein FI711_00915 [SAR202 cluster bacterium]|nr:hypothetical protein [SAR202 cluster bacterium]